MSDDFNGSQVIDANADDVGAVEESYEDASGTIRFVKVKIGSLLAKHRLVPVEGAEQTDDGLQVPYTKDAIEHSPDASEAGDLLEGDLLEQARAYYAGGPRIADVTDESVNSAAGASGAAQQQNTVQAGEIRDAGDVIEIPIVEEQLVKRPVVKEVLRIRKSAIGEQQTVREVLRKEDVEVEQDPGVEVHESL
jgi:hypothetical protein